MKRPPELKGADFQFNTSAFIGEWSDSVSEIVAVQEFLQIPRRDGNEVRALLLCAQTQI